jgi:serine/threonine protein kinase
MNEPRLSEPLPEIENVEILEQISRGGNSIVYKARQQMLDRIVAIKVLPGRLIEDDEGLKRFQREVKLSTALDHPGIARTISAGISKNGLPFLLMEYLEGRTLAEELSHNRRLNLRAFRDTFLPLLSALQTAHDAGIVHADVKPENIVLQFGDVKLKDSIGGFIGVKLLDFGTAALIRATSPDALRLRGTPLYMSPEQCRSEALDTRSDLYSLACVMYEALAGEPPFTGNSAFELMNRHCNDRVPRAADLAEKVSISGKLAQLVVWGMNKMPQERPESAGVLAEELKKELDLVTPERLSLLRAGSRKSEILRTAITTTFMVALIVGIPCAFLYYPQAPTRLHESLREGRRQGPDRQKSEKLYKQAHEMLVRKNLHGAERNLREALKAIGVPTDECSAESSQADLSLLKRLTEVAASLPTNTQVDDVPFLGTVFHNSTGLNSLEVAELNHCAARLLVHYGRFQVAGEHYYNAIKALGEHGDIVRAENILNELRTLQAVKLDDRSALLAFADLSSGSLAVSRHDSKTASKAAEDLAQDIGHLSPYYNYWYRINLLQDLFALQQAAGKNSTAEKTYKQIKEIAAASVTDAGDEMGINGVETKKLYQNEIDILESLLHHCQLSKLKADAATALDNVKRKQAAVLRTP